MRLHLACLALVLTACAPVWGQAPAAAAQRFEVASIRPMEPNANRVEIGVHMDGAQARISGFSMLDCIAMAYDVEAHQVAGPDWLRSERYQVNATLPAGANADQIPQMMAALLTERFGMKFHREKKEVQAYVLTRGKKPLKLVAVDAPVIVPGVIAGGGVGSGDGISVDLGRDGSYTFANNKFVAKKMTLEAMAGSLTIYMELPVVDQTELKGNYDLTVEINPEDFGALRLRAARSAGITLPPQLLKQLDTATTPSLFEALDNAGLKMEARKVMQDVIVVDQISKTPTEN